MSLNHLGIDFETWAALAQCNPEAFEKCRSQLLNIALNRITATRRQKYERLQWRLDHIRRSSKTPLAACFKISEMMWDSFYDLQQLYSNEPAEKQATVKSPCATILNFKVSQPAKPSTD